ncbi:hypothetical protein K227x_02570 [Rubripirellula lacrimiformis]|uniref:Glycosyl hydrolase family 32 N-terminal domain-containing protein n=1 Tax=Rubripirellula lacrimiformis TaxID=1930273 RepID=A0A517N4F7_9BACT|nr:hypothetical protein [Rubripirellula lacrimiformis]QDT01888.1 hypothetical protein K227x_02570 [Rubripirellula lacrimiformis]
MLWVKIPNEVPYKMRVFAVAVCLLLPSLTFSSISPLRASDDVIDISSRRELIVDRLLIDNLQNIRLVLNRPRDEGVALQFDQPWEGLFCGYATVIKDGDLYRLYYRGSPKVGVDGNPGETYCYAESKDGIQWTKPELNLYEFQGSTKNNIVLADAAPVTHNFSPMLDSRPEVPAQERFKAIGGTMTSGLIAMVSPDGIHWKKLQEEPVIATESVPYNYMFDSQNVAFWSASEHKYLCYFRVFEGGIRRICRSTSDDFLNWSEPTLMEYRHDGGEAPIEHLYTNQTHPYFRAPHLYVSVAARFMPGRQVLSDAQADAINVSPQYFKDTSDAVLMTSRGGPFYDRTFLGGFVRPGIGAQNWVSRTNYPALNIVQTGSTEMSVYLNQDYAQPTSHLHRYSMRLDGFASAQAPYSGGELLTKPLTFSGHELSINFGTSAAGSVRVEIQDASGEPIPGFALSETVEQIGNEIDRVVTWKHGSDVTPLCGKPIRLRFVIKDADLYSFQFDDE